MTPRIKLLKKRQKAMDAIKKYDNGMSPVHIAEVMGENVATVSTWLKRRRHYELLAAKDPRILEGNSRRIEE